MSKRPYSYLGFSGENRVCPCYEEKGGLMGDTPIAKKLKAPEEEIKSKEGHKYYNVALNNNTTDIIPLIYQEVRSEPILDRPKDYHLAVIRMDIPSTMIPLFMWPTLTGQPTTPDNTFFKVYLYSEATHTSYFQNVVYQTNRRPNNLIPEPCVWAFDELCSTINEAYRLAFVAMKTAEPGLPQLQPPFIAWDAVKQLFGTFYGNQWDFSVAGANFVFPGMNYPLWKKFFLPANTRTVPLSGSSSIDLSIGFSGATSETYQSAAGVTHPYFATYGSYPGFSNSQQNQSSYLVNELQSIVLTTSMGIRAEFVPPQTQLGVSSAQSGTTQNTTLKIMTDFEPDASSGSLGTTPFQYSPFQFRYLDLLDDTPLRTFDFQVFWTDVNRQTHQLYLAPGFVSTFKFLFSRKDQVH